MDDQHQRDTGSRIPPSDADTLRRIADVLLQSGIEHFAEKFQQEFIALHKGDSDILENFDNHQAETSVDQAMGLRSRQIVGLDIVKGLDRFDGNEDTYLKLLRSYLNSIRSIIGAIEVVSETGLADYTLAVHSIKGTSRDILALPIGDEAAEMEKAAKARDFEFLQECNPAFRDRVLQLLDDIENLLADVNAQNSKPKKDKPDSAMLSQLLVACQNYDMDGADEAMAKIDEYQYESEQEFVDWLRKNVDLADFEEIIEKLA
ncbi:MAG: hypothetical protein FWG73_08620 [Planctomycetaceae bacterium]|nr:hypothetical protein [Planctomycetaceae bacterium]